jgi:hypothetical protein
MGRKTFILITYSSNSIGFQNFNKIHGGHATAVLIWHGYLWQFLILEAITKKKLQGPDHATKPENILQYTITYLRIKFLYTYTASV